MLRKYEGDDLVFEKLCETQNGENVVPAIAVDFSRLAKDAVLMLGYMNRAALAETIRTGNVTFYSRSTGQLWTKGATSGNFLKWRDIYTDCDSDTLLIDAEPVGPTCHTGMPSCFDESGLVQEAGLIDENI